MGGNRNGAFQDQDFESPVLFASTLNLEGSKPFRISLISDPDMAANFWTSSHQYVSNTIFFFLSLFTLFSMFLDLGVLFLFFFFFFFFFFGMNDYFIH
jgi:hypothetical protein